MQSNERTWVYDHFPFVIIEKDGKFFSYEFPDGVIVAADKDGYTLDWSKRAE